MCVTVVLLRMYMCDSRRDFTTMMGNIFLRPITVLLFPIITCRDPGRPGQAAQAQPGLHAHGGGPAGGGEGNKQVTFCLTIAISRFSSKQIFFTAKKLFIQYVLQQKTIYSFFIFAPCFCAINTFYSKKYLLNIISLVLCRKYFLNIFLIFPPLFLRQTPGGVPPERDRVLPGQHHGPADGGGAHRKGHVLPREVCEIQQSTRDFRNIFLKNKNKN